MSSPAVPSAWRHAFVPGLMSYLDASSIITTGIALVLLQDRLGLTPWTIGALSGILTATLALGAFVGGRLADLLGRRRVFLVDLVGYVIGAGLLTLVPTRPVLWVAITLLGLTMGIGLPTSLALIAESATEGKKGRMVGLSSALWMVAILTTLLLSTAFAHLGPTGARILFGHLLVVGLLTLVLGFGLHESQEWRDARSAPGTDGTVTTGVPLRSLLTPRLLAPLLVLAAFYTLVNLAANTLGQFQTYLFVTLAGVDAGRASFLGLCGIPFGVLAALAFMRIADSPVRKALYVVGAVLQVAAFAAPIVFGFSATSIFFLLTGAGLGGGFAGEGIYKVWSQELFPTAYRATAQGLTYGVTRGLTAAFAVVTPSLIAADPVALMWILTGLVTAGGLIGSLVVPRMGARRGTDPWLRTSQAATPSRTTDREEAHQ